MRINNNLMALNTYNNLGIAANSQAKSMEKLSSGLRINRAGDDAAGLAISEKMRAQIRGLDQASRNAQDGISLVQTAEGALNESQSILQRMRELAVQSANDTNESDDRTALQNEVNQLAEELDRIADTTEFNGKTLLDGSAANINLQIGANAGQDVALSVGDMRATSAAGLNIATAAGAGVATLGDVAYVSGTGDEVASVNVAGYTGTSDLDIKIEITTAGTAGTAATQATITINGQTQLNVAADAVGAAAPVFTLNSANFDAFDVGDSVVVTMANTPIVGDEVNIDVAGATAGTITGPDITSSVNAQTSITNINTALEKVSQERSKLGAVQNRLEHTISNLNTSFENLQSSESRIRDVDMAKEMMTLTKNNILQQAAQAMLAQANQAPQGVLQLLRQ